MHPFEDLKHVERVDLSNNKLSSFVLPKGCWLSLTALDLSDNPDLSFISLDALLIIDQLVKLNISGTKLANKHNLGTEADMGDREEIERILEKMRQNENIP